MARTLNRLSPLTIKAFKGPGRLNDGGGLYLVAPEKGGRTWYFYFRWLRKRKEMSLGPADSKTITEVRAEAEALRRQVRGAINPIDFRKSASQPAAVRTLSIVGHEYINGQASGWSGAKTKAGWRRSLDKHFAEIKNLPISEITIDRVVDALKPIWLTRSESAGKARERLERIMDFAIDRGDFTGSNPARWKGRLSLRLPKRAKLQRGHFAAMPYDELPAYMLALGKRKALSARALEWTILTAARTGMVLGMQWSEISGNVWTVPAERMKDRKPHRVPLSAASLAILDKVRTPGIAAGFVFPSGKNGPMSNMTMLKMLAETTEAKVTVHGFRSTFRDWAGDRTEHAREVAEGALAHAVGNQTEQSYRRGDALEKRRLLMVDWADYCTSN